MFASSKTLSKEEKLAFIFSAITMGADVAAKPANKMRPGRSDPGELPASKRD